MNKLPTLNSPKFPTPADSEAELRRHGIRSLVGCTSIIMLLWLVVLPWVAEQPPMKSHIQWLDEQGIDPAAMYYTELEVMETILQRQRAAGR